MSGLATLAGATISLAAIGFLAATDSKRRRAFRLPAVERRYGAAAWTAVFVPGALVPMLSGAGGFFIWLGAASVAGWTVAATSPVRLAGWRQHLEGATRAVLASVATLRRNLAEAAAQRPTRRIAELERRVRDLEAELAALRGFRSGEVGAGVVIELARPSSRR